MPLPPVAGQAILARIVLGNSTVSTPISTGEIIPRPFFIADVFYRVRAPDGANADFGHRGRVRIPVDGLVHETTRSLPAAGTYRVRPVVIREDGQEAPGQTDSDLLVVAIMVGGWTAWAYAADGGSASRTRTTTFTDNRSPIVETQTRVFNDDGSIDETTTATDGRAPVTVRIAQPITSLSISVQ